MGIEDNNKQDSLREKAELLISNNEDTFQLFSQDEIKAIVHELTVHQIELEMQNNELKKIQHQLIKTKDSFTKLFEYAPVGYVRLNDFGLILQCNNTFQQLLDKNASQIEGHYFADFIHPDDTVLFNSRYKAFYNKPENKVIEVRLFNHKQNTDVFLYLELKGRRIDNIEFSSDPKDKGTSLLVNCIEITRHKSLEESLKLAAKVFDNSKEGILILDSETKIQRVNHSFSEITGYEPHEVLGRTPRLLKSGKHSRSFYDAMWNAIRKKGHWQGEIWNKRKNGELYIEWLSISCTIDTYGRVSHYIGIFTDITQRKHDEQHIEHLAHFDSLTDLPNRTLLHDRLNQAIIQANRNKTFITVLFLDLDRFKILNDTLGHFIGDLLLQEVGQRLQSCVRESDTVARFGGDEFVIVLSGFDNETIAQTQSENISQNILTQLSKTFELSDHQYKTSTSIGFSIFPKDGNSESELIKNADAAMYHAKTQGRNNFQAYSKQMHLEAINKGTLENDLNKALENNEFVLYYQTIVDIKNPSKIVGFEALIRWFHPTRGLINPNDFIPLAEETGTILQIGQWVLTTACKQLKQWHNEGHSHLKMSINLSARQFLQNDLFSTIIDVLKEEEIDANFLDFEITETVIMQNMKEASNILKCLINAGSSISMDDFGTGYSSLTYLKKFSITRIKIDRSFVNDITTDTDDQVIVKSIMAIAKHMQLEVLLEGIENEPQLNYLKKEYCQFSQGYYFSKPLPAELIEFENNEF